MVWDMSEGTSSNGDISISVELDGRTEQQAFGPDTTVRAALEEIADRYDLTRILVEDTHGEEITPSMGDRTLRQTGSLKVVRKLQGAK